MGALGYTMFCENGHIVDIVGHHEISNYDESEMYCPVHGCVPTFDGDDLESCICEKRPPCSCGSTNFRSVCEWGDEDYNDNDGDGPVPRKSIGSDELISDTDATIITVEVDNHHSKKRMTGKLVVKLDRYNVSALFSEEGGKE